MKNQILSFTSAALLVVNLFGCQSNESKKLNTAQAEPDTQVDLDAKVALGKHLVVIAGCHDCHTPRKMGPMGPEMDMSRALSGHPAQVPIPEIDRNELESKGIAATQSLTAWMGPWGVSFSSNLTSDETGIGNWTEEQFFIALRDGKSKGIPTNRQILPPMPYEMIGQMTDEEISAVFAYLKSTTPIDNVVPQPIPPLNAMKP
ncbi:c-type cytochrome [Algoriphagus sp.]|uniref:c-type cytochrome n=1 Tax=Algoriphagus sp. TaxID=1872435 RepID=UPI0026269CD5|nr:c-type cytochrome [Algoriphagus sp.]